MNDAPIPDWQPMETAPTDTRILLWVERSGYAFGSVRVFSDGERIVRAEGHSGVWKAVGWWPLPSPPA